MSVRSVVILAIVGLAVLAPPAAGISSDSVDDDPVPVPVSFYGTVTIDGEPAPVGTELVAKINEENRGSILVGENGTYGGPNAFDEKLVVDGTAKDDGQSITFLVNGKPADQTAVWTEGKTTRFDMTVEDRGKSGTRTDRSGSNPSVGGSGDQASPEQDEDTGAESDGADTDNGNVSHDSGTGPSEEDSNETETGDGPGDEQSNESSRREGTSINDGDEKEQNESAGGTRSDGLPGFGLGGSIVTLLIAVHSIGLHGPSGRNR